MRSLLRHHFVILLLVVLYSGFAFATYSDYGITYDEYDVYNRGKLLYAYFLNDDPVVDAAFAYESSSVNMLQVYNHAYAAFLYMLNGSESYEIYHLLNMLLLIPLLIASYWYFFQKFHHTFFALLAPLFLLFMPRFIGHAPGNPKDFPFAVFYGLSLLAIPLSKQAPQWMRIMVLGILFGITHALRIIGIGVYAWFVAYVFLLSKRDSSYIKAQLHELLFIGLIGFGLHIASQPFLYTDTVLKFGELFAVAKNFPWDGQVLFFGSFVRAMDLPFTYLPSWIVITTPALFIVFLGIGVWCSFRRISFFSFLSLFLIGHFLVIMLFDPILYDGLRHFLFVLPAISWLAAYGCIFLLRSLRSNYTYAGVVGLCLYLASVGYSMYALYPYTYVYFNEFVGGLSGASGQFETDYWAASYKESSEWLSRSGRLQEGSYVYVCDNLFQASYYLPSFVTMSSDPSQADFGICTTRNNKHIPLLEEGVLLHATERQQVPLSYVVDFSKR